MVLIENSFKEEHIMKNKLLLSFILITSGVNSFTYSPFLDARYDYVDVSALSRRYAQMHVGPSVSTPKELPNSAKQETVSSHTASVQSLLNDSTKQNKNFGAHSAAKPATVFTKPIAVKNIPMFTKVAFSLVGLGGLKSAYDFFKKEEASSLDVQQSALISGNNFKKRSAIGITVCALIYAAYKAYCSDFFTKTKQLSEEK